MQSKVNVHCTIEYEATAIEVFLVNCMPNWDFQITNLCIASSQLGNGTVQMSNDQKSKW